MFDLDGNRDAEGKECCGGRSEERWPKKPKVFVVEAVASKCILLEVWCVVKRVTYMMFLAKGLHLLDR